MTQNEMKSTTPSVPAPSRRASIDSKELTARKALTATRLSIPECSMSDLMLAKCRTVSMDFLPGYTWHAVSKYAPLVLSFVPQVPPQLAYFLSLMLSILFSLVPSFYFFLMPDAVFLITGSTH